MQIILDTSIVTLLVTESSPEKEAYKCKEWLLKLLAKGVFITIPEICWYEIHRGILFIARKKGKEFDIKLRNLENLSQYCQFLPLNMEILSQASYIWSDAMLNGYERPKGVDVDMLVLAHLRIERQKYQGRRILVATKNLKDFQLFRSSRCDELA